jgi:4-azaleucine resistance transporter AzlC
MRALGRGFLAALPLWPGIVAFGLVYAVVAGVAGLSAWQIQLMSALVFAGASQVTAAGLVAQGAPAGVLIASTALINLRHVLYGLSLSAHLPRNTRRLRPLVAFLLTDESYSLGVRAYLEGQGAIGYYLGAGISTFVSWNLGTALGVVAGRMLADPKRLGLDLVFPLTFAALLAPLLRDARARGAAAVAFAAGLVLIPALPRGIGLVAAALLGVVWGSR